MGKTGFVDGNGYDVCEMIGVDIDCSGDPNICTERPNLECNTETDKCRCDSKSYQNFASDGQCKAIKIGTDCTVNNVNQCDVNAELNLHCNGDTEKCECKPGFVDDGYQNCAEPSCPALGAVMFADKAIEIDAMDVPFKDGSGNEINCLDGKTRPAGTKCKLSCKHGMMPVTAECMQDVDTLQWNNKFECRPPTIFECPGDGKIMECPRGYVIQIITAFWGRKNNDVCTESNMPPPTTTCWKDISNEIGRAVSQSVQTLTRCPVPSTTELGTDPCLGKSKYVEIEYKCGYGD